MKSRKERLAILREILETSSASSQEQLTKMMAERGVNITQATLSRYLKRMKVVKTVGADGEYTYRYPVGYGMEYRPIIDLDEPPSQQVQNLQQPTSYTQLMMKQQQMEDGFKRVATKVDFSGNIIVIHTRPGYASSLASELDENGKEYILGTVAGDDTIIAVKKEDVTQNEVKTALRRIIPPLFEVEM